LYFKATVREKAKEKYLTFDSMWIGRYGELRWDLLAHLIAELNSILEGARNMRFLAQIQGGVGPDVWDTEIFISAADFRDAAEQAATRAAETGGQVTQLEQSDEQPYAVQLSAHERLIDRLANELLTAHVHKAQLKAALSGYVHGDTEGGWNAFVAEQILATPNEDATIHELRRAERERVISEVRKLSASGGGCPLSDSNIQGYNDAITQVIETIRKLGDE
jgi:hypothetical protein